jgi:excisionase family DNA binding protein
LVRGIVVDRVVVSTPLDPFLPLRQLATYAGLSVRKLRELLDDPTCPLPAYQVGGKILVRRSEFDAWMAAHRRQRGADVDNIVNEVLGDL